MDKVEFKELLINVLDVSQYEIKGDELWTLCLNPAHVDRHPTNFSINLKTGKAFCFACGFSGNIVTLLSDRGFAYDKAIQIWNYISDFEELTEIPNYRLDRYLVEAYKANGFSASALERVKGDKNLLEKYNVYSDRFGNPIFLIKSAEQEWKAVWVKDGTKYLLLEPLQSKAYGDLFGEHLTNTEFTILTEGFFDAMYTHRVTGLKTVCGNGTYLSKSQLVKLRKAAPIIVLTDFDEMGRLARDRLHDQLSGIESYFCGGKFNNLDPDDLTSEQLLKVIETKKSWFEYLEFKEIRSRKNEK